MKITLLCNAGLSLEYGGETLLIDLPNEKLHPYYPLPEDTWHQILKRENPYERISGLYYTHKHPDHFDEEKVSRFREMWPEVPVFTPVFSSSFGKFAMGVFSISYALVDHAPLPWPAPPHVVTWIEAGGKSLYIAADAALDTGPHYDFLAGRQADIAIWNSMYLSRQETRKLMHNAAKHNYICHMPLEKPDDRGIWRKCSHNLERYREELHDVTVMDTYPFNI